jgi:short-chain Z-isoprenyl diphosphate synthase
MNERTLTEQVSATALRRLEHAGIILDGHRGAARERTLALVDVYSTGADRAFDFVRWCASKGLNEVSAYCLSIENMGRPEGDLDALAVVLHSMSDRALRSTEFNFHPFGDLDGLREYPRYASLCDKLDTLRAKERIPGRLTFNLGVHYSGVPKHARKPLIAAVKDAVLRGDADMLRRIEENPGAFELSAGVSELQLIVRPGGKKRLSGFLLEKAAYAEMLFLDKPWIDCGPDDWEEWFRWFHEQEYRGGK